MPKRASSRPCFRCGTEFQPWNHQVKKGHGLYCSNRCKGDAMTTRVLRTCAICNGTIDRELSKSGPYCSISCAMRSRKIPEPIRAWALVEIRSADECWPSLCAHDKDGYPLFTADGPRQRVLTRVIWELANGRKLQPDELVLHTCDNPPCCNPAHLYAGTYADNAADRERKGRSRWQRMRQS